MHELFRVSPKITALPVIHGSGDFALEVRRVMLNHQFDCLAVPLPPSFQADVEESIRDLPAPGIVVQDSQPQFSTEWTPETDDDDLDDDAERSCTYVPIDPCQSVIMGLRIAQGERMARRFIDLETAEFEPLTAVLPDPYALKRVSLERFAATMLPVVPALPEGQPRDRVSHMAGKLRELEHQFESILVICSILEWPWLRDAYRDGAELGNDEEVEEPLRYSVEPNTLIFLLGELPFITALYERARAELGDDENLSIDGVKELLLTARQSYRTEFAGRARKITPQMLSKLLQYIRNLSLIDRRLTPDLYTSVVAAKQIAGDQFALHVAETARQYPIDVEEELEAVQMGIEQARLPDGNICQMVSRLPGPPLVWRSCELKRRPDKRERDSWKMRWNPYSQCSYPPEDDAIEDFRSHVFDRAKAVMGADLARTEKFTTSIMDGIDVRDTLRHWYDQEIYVKVLPPSRGRLDCAVMLFDSPADPRDYPWRTTWFAEHANESTLAFFATDFRREMVGPGIGLATYGGAMFLFPPISVKDIWTDPALDFTETMEERLLAAACLHSDCPHIALLSPLPPGAGWRRLAKRFKKTWVHLPLGQFGDSTVQQLRMVHVLNGKQVRSYAADFIRRA